MKRKVFIIVIYAVLLISIPITLVVCAFCTSPRFSETYYGELSKMYSRLKTTEGKKIVVIGTSSVAFGVDSELIETELNDVCNQEYKVVNFGLYGALGTKIMLDLSLEHINEGDIVIFAPEPHAQSTSLYFSAKDFWYSLDSDFSLLSGLKKDNATQVLGNFVGYVSEKFSYLRENTSAKASGVYSLNSFNDRCDLKNYDRPYNVMSGGVDVNDQIVLDYSIYSADFITYVNDYIKTVSERGGEVCFSFAPVNKKAVTASDEDIKNYYDFIDENFDCEIIGNPYDYILDCEWFYDSNYHLNESGMTLRSIKLLNDIKNHLEISTPTKAETPDKPELPNDGDTLSEGNNAFIDYFTYEESDGGYEISGITEEGKTLRKIILPYSYNGKIITSFSASVFADNTTVEEMTVQRNITTLKNNSFNGATSLKKLILEQEDPTKLGVGQKLLVGADDCYIYVKKDSLGYFVSNYFWSYYADKYQTYD